MTFVEVEPLAEYVVRTFTLERVSKTCYNLAKINILYPFCILLRCNLCKKNNSGRGVAAPLAVVWLTQTCLVLFIVLLVASTKPVNKFETYLERVFIE